MSNQELHKQIQIAYEKAEAALEEYRKCDFDKRDEFYGKYREFSLAYKALVDKLVQRS